MDIGNGIAEFAGIAKSLCLLSTPKNNLKLYKKCPKLYFLTEKTSDSQRLCIDAYAGTPDEHICLTIKDEKGNILFRNNSLGKDEHKIVVDIPLTDEQLGKIWQLRAERLLLHRYEDIRIVVREGARPYLAMHPDQLCYRVFEYNFKPAPNGGFELGCDINPLISKLAKNTVSTSS